MAGPLQDIRVLEAGLLIQGPQAAALLADMGADVIKIELPGVGDHSRHIHVAPDDPRSAVFEGCNRGKRSIALDLRSEPVAAAFKALAETADVFVSNFKPGTLEEWGLGFEHLAKINPRIICAQGSTFGPLGPDAEREGADLAGQAAGGLISTTGQDADPPTPVGAFIADHIGSLNMVSGILAALHVRRTHWPRPTHRSLSARRPDLGPGNRVHALSDDRFASPAAPTWGTRSSKRHTASSRPKTAGSASSAFRPRPETISSSPSDDRT